MWICISNWYTTRSEGNTIFTSEIFYVTEKLRTFSFEMKLHQDFPDQNNQKNNTFNINIARLSVNVSQLDHWIPLWIWKDRCLMPGKMSSIGNRIKIIQRTISLTLTSPGYQLLYLNYTVEYRQWIWKDRCFDAW